jgi:hypothetical protein
MWRHKVEESERGPFIKSVRLNEQHAAPCCPFIIEMLIETAGYRLEALWTWIDLLLSL